MENYRKRQKRQSCPVFDDDPDKESPAAKLAEELKRYFEDSNGRHSNPSSSRSSVFVNSSQYSMGCDSIDNDNFDPTTDVRSKQSSNECNRGHESQNDDQEEEV